MSDNSSKNESGGVDLQRPFPGLQSFEEKNESQFGGRDIEVNELFLLTKRNSPAIVFGKSGIGKTSLIKAGLMPVLKRNNFYPIYFRIDYASVKSPLRQLKNFVSEKFKIADPTATDIGNRSLWEYFHDVKLSGGSVTPVLILDQFEETFTIGKDKRSEVSELITELSDLAENRVPFVVYQDYQNRDELIPSHYERLTYRVIISLREDYLAQLEGLKKYLPSLKNSRYRIVQMTALQAMAAVLKSAKGLIDKNVAVDIIKKLPGITDPDFDELADDNDNVKRLLVEPFLLSLICFQINEKRIERKLEKFTAKLVSEFKIEDVIHSFYNDTLKTFDDNVSEGIEKTMLTDTGYRKLEAVEQLKTNFKIKDDDITALINKRIIRQEDRDGVEYVELIHDVLIPIIKEKRNNRIAKQNEIAERQKEDARQKAFDAEVQRKNLKRTKLYNTVISVFAILAIGASVLAINRSIKAYKQTLEATKQTKIAEKNSQDALEQSRMFEEQKRIADSLRTDVSKQRDDFQKSIEKAISKINNNDARIQLNKILEEVKKKNPVLSLQDKYASLLNVQPDSIKDEVFYHFIDKWLNADKSQYQSHYHDCSSFIKFLFSNVYFADNKKVTADLQFSGSKDIFQYFLKKGKKSVEMKNLKESDLVFFSRSGLIDTSKIDHIGIYLQNNKFLYYTDQGENPGVKIKSIKKDFFWKDKFISAIRL